MLLLPTTTSLLLLGGAPTRPSVSNVRCCAVPPPPPDDATPPSAEASSAGDKTSDDKTYSDGWSGAGRFSDDEALPLSFWLLGPSPRRAILPGLAASLIAPAVNLYGSGSLLLSLVPDLAREKRLDTFYPVSTLPGYPYTNGRLDYAPGFQRYFSDEYRFEFRYPATYVQDQSVYLRNVDRACKQWPPQPPLTSSLLLPFLCSATARAVRAVRAARAACAAHARVASPLSCADTQRTMDPTLAATPSSQRPRRSSSGPVVALGPVGGTGEENLSVVTGPLEPGFTLRGTLGDPEAGAERLIQATIAKPGLREVTLLAATERASARSGRKCCSTQRSAAIPQRFINHTTTSPFVSSQLCRVQRPQSLRPAATASLPTRRSHLLTPPHTSSHLLTPPLVSPHFTFSRFPSLRPALPI